MGCARILTAAALLVALAACKDKSGKTATATATAASAEPPVAESGPEPPPKPAGRDLVPGFDQARVKSAIDTPPKGAVAVLAARDGLRADYGQRAPVYGFRFYDGGKKIAGWYLDRAVRLWDLERRERFARLELAESELGPSSVAYSPAKQTLYVATDEPRVLELAADGTPLRELAELPDDLPTIGQIDKGLADVIGTVAVAAGQLVVGASGFLVVDLESLRPVRMIGYEPARDDGPAVASCLRVSADGKQLAWHDEAGDMTIYDLATVDTVAQLPGPHGPWSGNDHCAASRDGSRVALAGGALMIYDVASKERLVHLPDKSIDTVAMSADGKLVAYTHGDGMVSLLRLPARAPHKSWAACPDSQVDHLELTADGSMVGTACGGDIILWPTR